MRVNANALAGFLLIGTSIQLFRLIIILLLTHPFKQLADKPDLLLGSRMQRGDFDKSKKKKKLVKKFI